MAIDRDTDELKRRLENHSVAGYPVNVPIFGDAVIVRQEATGPVKRITEAAMTLGSPMVYYFVKPVRPMPFEEWARTKNLSAEPFNLKQWQERLEDRHKRVKVNIVEEVWQALERGERASEWDIEYADLKDRGCIGPDKTVICYSFWSDQVEIPRKKLKRGMLVEFEGPPEFIGAGQVVGFGKKNDDVVLVEVFTPVSYFSSTDAIANEEIRPGFYSSRTYSIGYGTREIFESHELKLPPGKFLDEKGREYILDEMIDISEIEKVCKQFADEGHCLWQSLIYYILPVNTGPSPEDKTGKYAGTFHPLPEKAIPSEYVVSYEDE